MKILFLDIDGVCNCKSTIQKGIHFPIDPYMAFLVGKIQLDTDCEVVLSSSWRHHDEGVAEIEKRIVKIKDRTGHCCTGIRGCEIYKWIHDNVPYEDRNDPKKFMYAILDDEGDMLLWQKDNFFQTKWESGLTEEIAEKIISHLNQHD